jgi:hypothetical protein
MVARAGSGDTVLVEQLHEYTFWGAATSNPTDDPNPRLEAYIAAARRGAKVRILLDSAYDDPGDVRGNTATCAYADAIATSEGLDLDCELANPTGTGIHNKMVLVLDGGTGYVHTGSINGSENSSKGNREFAVQVRSNDAFDYLADVFWYDWGRYVIHFPIVVRGYLPSAPQADLYIEALQYDASDESVQITNRGTAPQDMTGWRIHSVVGDQWYDFPAGYTLATGASVQVHSGPDALDNPPTDLLWGYAYIWRNDGDVAILYNSDDEFVDSYAYSLPPPHPIEYLNYDGQQTTEQWFRGEFGEFIIEELPTTEYRVDVMAAATGYATFRIRVLDENRDPVADYPVDWYWTDGHIPSQTNAEGWAEFAMGGGAYYQPGLGQVGPHWVTVGGTTIWGIGMILYTEHNHFDVVVWAGQPTSPDEKRSQRND